jgi:NurA-like 5'-3' nuclease
MYEKFFEKFLEKKEEIKNEIEKLKKIKIENLKWKELPKEKECDVVAIDGSYNFLKFKSFVFYAISAIAISYENKKLRVEDFYFDVSIFPNFFHEIEEILKVKMLEKELEFANKFDKTTILDGSLSSFYNFKPSFLNYAKNEIAEKSYNEWKRMKEIIKEISKKEALVFSIAKNFSINENVLSLGYENLKSGYSEIFEEKGDLNFIYFYFKLNDKSQVFKCVTFEKNRERVEEILSILKSLEINGYPYILKKAHYEAKIGNKEMESMAKILGIVEKTEREIL